MTARALCPRCNRYVEVIQGSTGWPTFERHGAPCLGSGDLVFQFSVEVTSQAVFYYQGIFTGGKVHWFRQGEAPMADFIRAPFPVWGDYLLTGGRA
jgi:hypothetical protein